jgi:type II secretory pathway pseudopilin PulG
MNSRYKELLIAVALIAFATALFFAVFTIVADRIEVIDAAVELEEDYRQLQMDIQARRTSELQGWNVNNNPEL